MESNEEELPNQDMLEERIKELLGLSDEGFDLFNKAKELNLTVQQQEEVMPLLDILEFLLIKGRFTDSVIEKAKGGSLENLQSGAEAFFDGLESLRERTTDENLRAVIDETLQRYEKILYPPSSSEDDDDEKI